MNSDKTRIMSNTGDIKTIILNEQKIENVNEYIYLRQIMNKDKENLTTAICWKVRLVWAGFGMLKYVLKNKNFPHDLNIVFDSCILSVFK